jgi:hypothetical protein
MMDRTFAAMLVLGLAACGTSYAVPPSTPTLLANAQPTGEVRSAVISALVQRRYLAEAEAPGSVTAQLDKGGAALRVVVEYDQTHFRINVIGFDGYKSEPGPDGMPIPEERVSKEVSALRKAIDLALKRPAKERAEAERKEREYQLLLEQQRTAQAQAQAAQAQASEPRRHGNGGGTFVVPVPVPQIDMPTLTAESSSTSGTQSITCCINGSLYNCPSQDAYHQCMSTNPSACSSAGRCN